MVVEGGDGGRRGAPQRAARRALQRASLDRPAAVGLLAATPHRGRVGSQARTTHGLRDSRGAARRRWAADRRRREDLAMPQPDQMIDHQPEAVPVGGAHDVDARGGGRATDHHHRHRPPEALQLRDRQIRPEQDQRLAAEVEQGLDRPELAVGLGDRTQHDLVAVAVRGRLDRLDHVAVKGVAHPHRDAQMLGAAQLEQAGGAVGAIAEALGRREDPRPGALTRPGHSPEHDRDQRLRDPGSLGHVAHGGACALAGRGGGHGVSFGSTTLT